MKRSWVPRKCFEVRSDARREWNANRVKWFLGEFAVFVFGILLPDIWNRSNGTEACIKNSPRR